MPEADRFERRLPWFREGLMDAHCRGVDAQEAWEEQMHRALTADANLPPDTLCEEAHPAARAVATHKAYGDYTRNTVSAA